MSLPESKRLSIVSPEASPDQISAAQAESYLSKMKVFSKLAGDYSRKEVAKRKREQKVPSEKNDLEIYAFGGLCELYAAGGSIEKRERLQEKYGDDIYCFTRFLSGSQEKLKEAEEILNNAAALSKEKRMFVAVKSAFFCQGRAPRAQKQELLEIMGYDPRTISNLIESVGWTGLSLYADSVLIGSQSIPLAIGPHVKLYDRGASEMVAAAYVLDALALGLNTYMNMKNIKDKNLGVSPNFFATSLHMTSKKFLPNSKILQDLSIIVPSILPTLFSEITLFPLLFLKDFGVPITVFRNVLSAVNQTVLAGGAITMYNRAQKEIIKS